MDSTQEEKTSLSNTIDRVVRQYMQTLGNAESGNLHDLCIEQVEIPLLEAVMKKAKYNQVRAAKMLGISRGNLRMKLVQYFDDKYCISKNGL